MDTTKNGWKVFDAHTPILTMVRDKAALKRWLAAEFEKAPPSWLIPAHGDIVECAANQDAVRKLFI